MENKEPEFDDSEFDNRKNDTDAEAKELKQALAAIHKKLVEKSTEPITNREIVQFLRVVNYNFLSLSSALQAILLRTSEIDSKLAKLESAISQTGTQMQQFFDTNNMLDEIIETPEGSGSAPDNLIL